jgi:hypothetical protein
MQTCKFVVMHSLALQGGAVPACLKCHPHQGDLNHTTDDYWYPSTTTFGPFWLPRCLRSTSGDHSSESSEVQGPLHDRALALWGSGVRIAADAGAAAAARPGARFCCTPPPLTSDDGQSYCRRRPACTFFARPHVALCSGPGQRWQPLGWRKRGRCRQLGTPPDSEYGFKLSLVCSSVCLLLQDPLQSCSRGEEESEGGIDR